MSAGGTGSVHAARGDRKRARRHAADRLFFPLAAIHGALVVPLSVHGLQWAMLRESVLLLAVLMLFMGGRVIAPAAAGAIQRAGGHLEARVQPRIEAALLLAMLVALVLGPLPSARLGAGLALIAAGVLALVRLVRWRLPACRGRPDLWCLGLGYGWLGAGLLLLGLAWTGGWAAAATATHAITVGALGTLTTGVMARVRLTRSKRDPGREPLVPLIALLITLAALVRVLGGSVPMALAGAAALWSAGLLGLLVLLVRVPAR